MVISLGNFVVHSSVYVVVAWFYWTRKTVSNNRCQIVISKQTKTMKREHNTVYRSTLFFTGKKDNCTMTSFYYNYQNSSVCFFFLCKLRLIVF